MVRCPSLSRILGVAAAFMLALLVASPTWAAVAVKATRSMFTVGPGPHEVTIEVTATPALPGMCDVTLDFGDGANVTLKAGQRTAKHRFAATRPKSFFVKAVVGGGFTMPGVTNPCKGEGTAEVKAINPLVPGSAASSIVATPVKQGGDDTKTAIASRTVSPPLCQPPGCQQIMVEATPATTGPNTLVAFTATGGPFGQFCKPVIVFGDGKQEVMVSGATASTAAHAYRKPGKYTATVVCPLEKPVGFEVRSGSGVVTVQRGL